MFSRRSFGRALSVTALLLDQSSSSRWLSPLQEISTLPSEDSGAQWHDRTGGSAMVKRAAVVGAVALAVGAAVLLMTRGQSRPQPLNISYADIAKVQAYPVPRGDASTSSSPVRRSRYVRSSADRGALRHTLAVPCSGAL
jgi:hypothetical protein